MTDTSKEFLAALCKGLRSGNAYMTNREQADLIEAFAAERDERQADYLECSALRGEDLAALRQMSLDLEAAVARAEKAEAERDCAQSMADKHYRMWLSERDDRLAAQTRVAAMEDLLREHNDEDYCGCCETNDGNDYRGPCLYCRTREALSAAPAPVKE